LESQFFFIWSHPLPDDIPPMTALLMVRHGAIDLAIIFAVPNSCE